MLWDSQIALGGIRVKNRIVFPPLSCNWADKDGFVTSRVVDFYKAIAEGGAGMIVVSGTAVSPEGKGTDRSLCINDDVSLDGFERLAKAIRRNNSFASIQLMHVGGQGNPRLTGHESIAPSVYRCKTTGFRALALDIEEIAIIRQKFIHSAILAARAGFQAVELHLAHGYLLHEFLSAYTNNRSDAYGGSLENRARLILEIISGIYKEAPDIILGARVSGEDYVKGGIDEETNKTLLPLLEDAGIRYFSVTAGIYDTALLKNEAMERGYFFKYSKAVKKIVNEPVIGVGKILDMESAERHLADGDCDMVAIGRGLVADPMMLAKVKAGQRYSRCDECGVCQFLKLGKKELSCPVREKTYA